MNHCLIKTLTKLCGYDIKKTKLEIKKLYANKEWRKLKAVKTGNAYIADGSQFFNRPGPRLLDSVKIMYDIINDKNIYDLQGKGWEKINF